MYITVNIVYGMFCEKIFPVVRLCGVTLSKLGRSRLCVLVKAFAMVN